MEHMTAIIVEDMPQAAEALKNDLQIHCPQVNLLDTAGSVVEAAKLLRRQMPDLLFLDILLGDGTGFDLLDIFPEMPARVIFTTASDEYAIRAFRYAAIDYLLKPIEPEQLKNAVSRAGAQKGSQAESLRLLQENIKQPDMLPERLSLHTQEKIIIVEIAQILYCEADSNNTWFFLNSGERILVTRTLRQYELILERHHFIRTHQSYLVNQRFIAEFIKKDGGYLKMKNGSLLPVSFRKRAEVIEKLESGIR
jgi:two-component system, LytTR family, response regulator